MTTALVTGSTDGHGRYVARRLAERGWRVLVHGRSAERGATVVRDAGGTAELVLADLGSRDAVRGLADEVLERTGGALDVVVCNAGVATRERRESADGIELTFAVNHLAHVLLCERLVEAGAGIRRIVNVSSIAQAAFDWDDPLLERSYEGMRAYAQSKLAQVAWTFDLAPVWAARGITIDALHPATLMDTTMVREAFGRTHATVEEGGEATLALVDASGGTGRFFDGTREAQAHPAAYDAAERERIHALTARLL